MAAQSTDSNAGPRRRSRPGSGRAVAIACLVFAALISAPLLGVGAATSTVRDGAIADDSGTDAVEIDDALASADGTVEVVVRLEEPTIPADEPAADVADRLEDHAAETQDPVLEYAADTPGVSVETELWLTNAVVLAVDTDRVALEALAAVPTVEEIHENFEVAVPEPPTVSASDRDEADSTDAETASATGAPVTPGLDLINAPAVWDAYGTRGEGVRVAVLDTGVDPDHPDIDLYTEDPSDPTYPGGWAAFDETGARIEGSTPHDTGTHGTHVSGTVAGGAESGVRIGVAPDAELLHGRVMDETTGTFAQIVAGMEWALEADADVVSLSLGATGRHGQLIEPVRNAIASGAVVVAAVGNEGVDTSGSPANVYDAISVGAVHRGGAVPAFSGGERIERGEWAAGPQSWPETYVVPDVVAHGVAVTSAVPGGGYEALPGTSMATPHVAGAAALLRSIEPDATPAELSRTLSETARKPDGAPAEADVRYGRGIVDAAAAADELVASRGRAGPATAGDDSSDRRPLPPVAVPGAFAVLVAGLALGALLAARSLARADDP